MVHKRRLLILVFSIVASLALVLPIAVPEAAADGKNFVTGGGQITTDKQIGYKISFAGYVGYMEDPSLVEGVWQTNFHNVSKGFLVGARFHSTSIILLEFYQDNDWVPPDDPNANVAHFIAEGRLNGEDGYTLNVWLADRGEPGRMTDAIWMALWHEGAVLYRTLPDFPGDAPGPATLLTHGNFQIHTGLKAE